MQDIFYASKKKYFGPGTIKAVGEEAKSLEMSHVLLVTDETLANVDGGPVDRVRKYLDEAGISYYLLDKVKPNPRVADCEEGADIYRKENCDGIISVGGGSVTDAAKAIGVAVTHEADLREIHGEDVINPLPPFIAVNTTAGTGSEVATGIVLSDPDKKRKFSFSSHHNLPDVSFNDAELTLSLPPGTTAATGLDALTHAIESYVATNATPMTDAHALMAIKLIRNYLPKAYANGEDLEARHYMLYAQALASAGFTNSGLGAVHALSHQLGGFYDIAHGISNAVLLPVVMRYNLISHYEKYADIARYLGVNTAGKSKEEAADLAIKAVEHLNQSLNIPSSLKELDVDPNDFEAMAEAAMKDQTYPTNPRKFSKEEIIEIYQVAYEC